GMAEAEAQRLFHQHTGRSTYTPPVGGYAESVAIVGCQSGKTRIAATVADYEGITARRELDGTEVYCALVAQDQRASLRTLFAYARAPFESVPVLRASVTMRRADALTLDSGHVLAVYPCRPPAIRG